MMDLDFRNCKTKEDVEAIFNKNKPQFEVIKRNFEKLSD